MVKSKHYGLLVLGYYNPLQWLFAAVFAGFFTRSVYVGLNLTVPELEVPILAVFTCVAAMWACLSVKLVPNTTRFTPSVIDYGFDAIFLQLLVWITSAIYVAMLVGHVLLAIGVDPRGPSLLIAIFGGWAGVYLFQRLFVPYNWGPHAKPAKG